MKNKRLNTADITKSDELWLEDRGVKIKPNQIKKSNRINIHYAQEYQHKPWRFYSDML